MKIAVVPIFENWARARFPPSRSVEMQRSTDLDILRARTRSKLDLCTYMPLVWRPEWEKVRAPEKWNHNLTDQTFRAEGRGE